MQWTEGIPTSDWDERLFKNGGHFLQSSHWAAFQAAVGNKVFYLQGENYQILALFERSRVGNRVYCPYGPTAITKGTLQESLKDLQQLGAQQGAVFARIEPITDASRENLASYGLKPAFKNIQPGLTWVQDLTKSHEQLLAELTATNRNLYNNFATKGLRLRASHDPTDMPIFIGLMAEVAKYNKILQHTDHYYQTMADTLLPRKAATLYIAEHNGKPVATAFCFDSPTTRYYAHAAADYEARKLHPSTPLLVQMMFDAKAAGQTTFDFVGVAPQDAAPTHRWAGFTKFKQSFGGDYKLYKGTWELPVNGLWYGLYRGAYHIRNSLR